METINFLNIDESRVLKQIVIIGERNGNDARLGCIIYTRPLSHKYNFIKELERNKDLDEISRIMNYDRFQEDYPVDRIDEIILDAVKQAYPKSVVHNERILVSTDLEKIERLKRGNVVPTIIYFLPQFQNFDRSLNRISRYPIQAIAVNIYTHYSPSIFDGQEFDADCNLNKSELSEQLKTVEFK